LVRGAGVEFTVKTIRRNDGGLSDYGAWRLVTPDCLDFIDAHEAFDTVLVADLGQNSLYR
jgi:hypothetical protein